MLRQSSENYAYRIKKKNNISSQDGNQVKSFFKTFRWYETMCGIFSLITIVSIIADYESYYNKSSQHGSCNLEDSLSENFRIISVFSCLISFYCLICKYLAEDAWVNITLKITPDTPGNYLHEEYKYQKKKYFFIESVIILIVPIPYYDLVIKLPQHHEGENFLICYRLSTFLVCFGFLRIYFVVRSILSFSIFHNEQALIFCIKNNVDTGISFAVKCIMNSYPLPFIGFSAIITMLIGMFIAKIFERPFESKVNIFYDYLPNYLWFLFETIGTQGFGDYTCVTYGCRIVAIFTWFFGSIIFGLIIVYMQQLSELNHFEDKAFRKIRLFMMAAKVLKASVQHLRARKRGSKNLKKYKDNISKACEDFKALRIREKNLKDENHEFEYEINKMNQDIKYASKKLDHLIQIYKDNIKA